MPSNGATAKVVHIDLDLHFQGHKFRDVDISKTVRANEKVPKYDFYTGLYLPSNGTIANVVLHDLDLHFQVKLFVINLLEKRGGGYLRKICLHSHAHRRGVAIVIKSARYSAGPI